MKKKKYVGILVSNRRQQKRTLKIYQKYTTKNVVIFTFLPSSIKWDKKEILGIQYSNNQYRIKKFHFPEVIYNRYYGSKSTLFQRFEKVIGSNKCFNHRTRLNKQLIHELLNIPELNPYLPETLPFNEMNFEHLFNKYKTIYLKPSRGSGGKGVYRIEFDGSGEMGIAQHHFSPTIKTNDLSIIKNEISKIIGTKPYIIQQGISFMQYNGKNFDIRVLVQKNSTGLWQVTNLISRVAYEGYFNTSACEKIYSSEKILQAILPSDAVSGVIQSLHKISLKAAAHVEENGGFHMGELSVDFGIDHSWKPWIIEINGYPQKGIYKELDISEEVYKNPIQYALYLLS